MGVDSGTAGIAVGQAGQLFERNARSLGFQNRFALDAMLTAQDAEDRMEQLRGQVGVRTAAQLKFHELGVERGFLGLRTLTEMVGKPGAQEVTLKGAFRAFTGRTDISDKALTKFMTGSSAMFDAMGDMGAEQQAKAGAGIQTILQALQTGTLNGKRLTDEEITDMRKALMSGDPNEAIKFGESNVQAYRTNLVEQEANRLLGHVVEGGKFDQTKFKTLGTIDKKTRMQATDIVAFRKALESGEGGEGIYKLLKAREKGMSLDDAINSIEGFEEGQGADEREFRKRVTAIRKDFSPAKSGLGIEGVGQQVIDILNEILDALIENRG
jgi:hypothetical protein